MQNIDCSQENLQMYFVVVHVNILEEHFSQQFFSPRNIEDRYMLYVIFRFEFGKITLTDPRYTLLNIDSLSRTMASYFIFVRLDCPLKNSLIIRTTVLWQYYFDNIENAGKKIIFII